jgi:hypothetical protein
MWQSSLNPHLFSYLTNGGVGNEMTMLVAMWWSMLMGGEVAVLTEVVLMVIVLLHNDELRHCRRMHLPLPVDGTFCMVSS